MISFFSKLTAEQGNSSADGETFPPVVYGLFGLALIALVIFLLPILLITSVVIVIAANAANPNEESQQEGIVKVLVVGFVSSIFLFGAFPAWRFGLTGFLFEKDQQLAIDFATQIVSWLNHFTKKPHFGVPTINGLRNYLWLWLPMAAVFFLAYGRFLPQPKQYIHQLLKYLCKPVQLASSSYVRVSSILLIIYGIVHLLALPEYVIEIPAIAIGCAVLIRIARAALNKHLPRDSHVMLRAGTSVFLGREKGSFVAAELTEAQLNHHVHIVGASGFGKSVLLGHIIENRIQVGAGMLFLDLKADLETIKKVQEQAAKAGRAEDLMIFSCGNPELSTNYNPLSHGTATQLRDRILNALTWSEEYYKSVSASFLLKCLIGLCWARDNDTKKFGLHEIFECVSNSEFVEALVLSIPNDSEARPIVESALTELRDKETLKSLSGLKSQLQSLIYSDFGFLLKTSDKEISIFEAVKQQKIVYILLDSRSYGESVANLGKLVIQDLKAVSARVDREIPKDERNPFSVVIDEFADMATEDFIGFLDRARSSRISVVVAHQELADLDRVSPELRKRLMNSTSTTFAFLQKIPESCEMLAAICGTRKTKEVTEQADNWILLGNVPTGRRSLKDVDEFIIHPNVIRSLPVGECVCVMKYPAAKSAHLKIRP